MTSVLLIGGGSFLAQGLAAQADPRIALTCVSHQAAIGDLGLQDYDVVINMALDPRYRDQPYDEASDRDLAAARAVVGTDAHYVMISSRKVYGSQAPFPASEDAPCRPSDVYGANKLTSEGKVSALLGARCTILRLANAFGFEPGRRSFFGLMLDRLQRERQIVLDVSPSVRRDFIPQQAVSRILCDVLVARPSGVFNLGAGSATALGDICAWLIEGYGQGEIVVKGLDEYDSFLLDCRKIFAIANIQKPPIDIHQHCNDIGRQLANA